MGFTFDAPLALLLLIPAIALTIGLHLGARRRMGAGRRRVALAVRAAVADGARPRARRLPARAAGGSPGDRVHRRPVRLGRQRRTRGRPRLPAGDAQGEGRRRCRRASWPSARTPSSSACRPTSTRSTGSPRRRSGRPRTSARRFVWPRRSSPTMRRSGSCCCPTATTRPAAARPRRPCRPTAGSRSRRGGSDSASVDEVLVERLTTPSIARLGESVQAIADIRSSVAQTATVRLFADGALVKTQPVELLAGVTRVTFDLTPSEAGFHTFRAVVEAGRDTFSQNDRADSNTIVKGEPRILVLAGDDAVAAELVGALEEQRQLVDTIIPEALPTDFASLATYDSVVLVDVPAAAPDRSPDGGPPGLRARPRQGPRDGRRAEQLRRRRLRQDRHGGDAARGHGRARPAEAARHRAGGRHRRVGFDGGLSLQHVQPGRRRPGSVASRRWTSARKPSCARRRR